jgi:hypothetical protein
MWGGMTSRGGLKTRPERRFPTGAQLDKLPHNRTVPPVGVLVVCGEQDDEYSDNSGAANPGCRRLSAGVCRVRGLRRREGAA